MTASTTDADGIRAAAADFTWMLNRFAAETAGVVDAIAVSSDGLLIAVSRPGDQADSERLAAIVSGITSLAAGRRGQLRARRAEQGDHRHGGRPPAGLRDRQRLGARRGDLQGRQAGQHRVRDDPVRQPGRRGPEPAADLELKNTVGARPGRDRPATAGRARRHDADARRAAPGRPGRRHRPAAPPRYARSWSPPAGSPAQAGRRCRSRPRSSRPRRGSGARRSGLRAARHRRACRPPLSVAEIAAKLRLHLNVVRVLAEDLHADRHLSVYVPERRHRHGRRTYCEG